MGKNKEDKRLIKGFFDENLSKEEKAAFLKKAASDSDFVKDFVNDLEQVAEGQAEENADDDKNGADDDEITEEPARTAKGRITIILSIAASLIIIVILQGIILPTNNQLYKRHYQPLSATGYITRGPGDDINSEFQKGIALYSRESYAASAEILGSIIKEQIPTENIILFAGLSYMGLEEFQSAITTFQLAISSGQTLLPEIAWYLALSYIKLGQQKEAIDLLHSLSLEHGYLGKQSTRLLRKIQ